MISIKLNLIGVDQLHLARGKQKRPANVSAADARKPGSGPKRHAKVRLPCFSTELATLNFERLLPPEILRLFVSQDFLGVSFRLDDP